MEKVQKANSIIHGVQAVVLVETAQNIFNQKILLVQDHDDRGRGDDTRRYGLPGGGIEPFETPTFSILRELREEVALELEELDLQEVGCFQKTRPSGLTNDNHLFVTRLNYTPDCVTNDPAEVSKVCIFELCEIIDNYKLVHEGSLRLIFHFLNGSKSGSLNEPVAWDAFIF